MRTCPLCLHDNPPDVEQCAHCGRYCFVDSTEPSDSRDLCETRMEGSASRKADPPAVMPTMTDLPPAVTPPPKARLVVIRGAKMDVEYPLCLGANYLGRTAERPADIDLSGLESPEQVWSSRQHAVLHFDEGKLVLEDLNSLNGTFVNRAKLHAGKRYQLKNGDVIQIGLVQLKVVL